MSNKTFTKLLPQEQRIRRLIPEDCSAGATRPQWVRQLKIELVTGFEAFHTRPYHNYEAWSQGWVITDPQGRRVEAEDLDEALDRYCDLVEGPSDE